MTALADDGTLLGTLARLQPLAAMDEAGLRTLLPLCRRERIARSLDALALRDWRDQVIYLHRGELKLDYADGGFEVLVGGSGAALAPLGRGRDAPVTTRAITDVELLRFDSDALDVAVTWTQLGEAAVDADVGDRRMLSAACGALSQIGGALAALPPAHIEALLERFRHVSVRRGEVVVRQGDGGDYYYVIETGRCSVAREVGGATVELAELKGGEGFGEEALLGDTVRNATVTMKTDGVLLRLDKADFLDLMREPLLHRIDAAEAARRVAAGAQWLDVRYAAEYRHDGLTGALNVPLNELRQAMALLDTEREYVVYCQSGRRSSAAAFLLSQRGFRASLLDGGLDAGDDTARNQVIA